MVRSLADRTFQLRSKRVVDEMTPEKQAALMLDRVSAAAGQPATGGVADQRIMKSLESVLNEMMRLTEKVDRLTAKVDGLQAAVQRAAAVDGAPPSSALQGPRSR